MQDVIYLTNIVSKKEPPIIKTERLILRPFTISDVNDVFEYASDPEWGEYLVNVPQPFAFEDAEKFVVRFSNTTSWEKIPMFAIVFNDKVIGEIYLNDLDLQNKQAELGYSLSHIYWGKGLTQEAARAVIDWAFQTYNLNKIYAILDPRNERSLRVLEKLGMVQEGLLRNHKIWQDEVRDVSYYGILRGELKWGIPTD